LGEVIATAVNVPHCYSQAVNAVANARMKEVAVQLMVRDCTSGFHFKHVPALSLVSVRIKRLFNASIPAKQKRKRDFVAILLASLYLESKLQEILSQNR